MKTVKQKHFHALMRDVTSLGGGFFSFFLVILLFIMGKTSIATQLFVGFFLIYPIAGIVRAFYFRNRPNKESYTNYVEKLDASSFPSIHAANSFYAAYVLHNAFASNPASVFFFFLAALIAYTRIYLKKHYLSDVVGGTILGLALSYLTVSFLVL